MYYFDTLKRGLIDNNAYELQASLSERVVVDGLGCHIFVSKLKKTKTMFPIYIGYPNSIKTYTARFIANFGSCTASELSKLLTSCLTAKKQRHVIKYCIKYMKDEVRTYFGL